MWKKTRDPDNEPPLDRRFVCMTPSFHGRIPVILEWCEEISCFCSYEEDEVYDELPDTYWCELPPDMCPDIKIKLTERHK